MEKRNVIEEGRTPEIDKQAAEDVAEKAAADLFEKKGDQPPEQKKDGVTNA
jgi:hypothetical protein